MKILTGDGWITAFLEDVECDAEKNSDIFRVRIHLLLVGKDAAARAASAIPRWMVQFDDVSANDGEKLLAEAMRKAKADTLEERVAEEMMDFLPGGMIRVESMTELTGKTISTAGTLNGAKRLFFRVSGDCRVRVIGYFMGKKA